MFRHINLRPLVILGATLLIFGCATVNDGLLKSPKLSEAEKDHSNWVPLLQDNKAFFMDLPDAEFCWTNIQANEDGIITNVNSKLRRNGFRKGQVIKAIEGERYTDENLLSATAKYIDRKEIRLTVSNGQSDETLIAQCEHGGKQKNFLISGIDHAIEKRWSECTDVALKRESARGYPSVYTRERVYLCLGYQSWFGGNYKTAFDVDLYFLRMKAYYKLIEYDKYESIDLDYEQSKFQQRAQYMGRTDLLHKSNVDLKEALAERRALSGKSVASNSREPKHRSPHTSTSQGTCFAISTGGVIATNHHVVEGKSSFTAQFGKNEPITLKLLRVSPSTDLAILKTEEVLPQALPLSSEDIELGADVYTFGYPVASMFANNIKYTNGVISGDAGFGGEASFLQTTVAIQPGNSGGPLVNKQGRVVGVTTSTARVRNFMKVNNGYVPQSINFAVKTDYLRALSRGLIPDDVGPILSPDQVKEAVCILRATS